MTFDELLSLRKYLVTAATRLTTLESTCGINTYCQWQRFGDSWCIVRDFMQTHPELP